MKKALFLVLLTVILNFGLLLVNKTATTEKKETISASAQEASAIEFKPMYQTVVNHGLENKKVVALSFDADMTPGMQKLLSEGKVQSYYNSKIIDILQEQNVPATLFLAGLWAENYPQATIAFSQNPLFEIGNHSYSHPAFTPSCFNLPRIKNADREKEFQLSQEILYRLTGRLPKLFRFPGGCYTNSDLNLAQKYGLTVIGWNVDSRDAFNSSKDYIIASVKKEVKPGSILIFHLMGGKNNPQTDKALPEVINYLRSEGYSFVKVGELLKELSF